MLLFTIGCKTVTDNKSITDVESDNHNESFLSSDFEEFYKKFHTDSTYQINHIVFPLEGSTYDEDNNPISIMWTSDNWVMHKEFDDMGGTFTRSYSEFGGIVSEKIIDDRNISNMERRFSKIQNEWHLIFYDPIHLTSN